ncbi:hotdog family protein [Microbulbifer variabilis]|uniref:Hotdog family protein n=1 Tax=Microbulbifer variabilis TaxID=266805 RepID=A0ABY4VBP6_9GAMM|nr:hotdog family protein [Microbulbifer variabilis]USD21644.1 hotdog family protein [Microbulbifer variabilis]
MQKYTAEELVPHSGNMSLLDEVVSVDEEQLLAKLRVRDDGIFSRNGRVPAYVGIEYMAQSIAAFSGYHAKERGKEVRLGFLLGTRKFVSNVESYRCGDELTIEVQRLLQAENGMATFECVIKGHSIEQSARLNVYQPDNVEQYLKGRN